MAALRRDGETKAADDEGKDSSRKSSKKRIITRVACNACRQRKIRCDGGRPSCSHCVHQRLPCQYDTQDDTETRIMALKRENEDLTSQLDALRQHDAFTYPTPSTGSQDTSPFRIPSQPSESNASWSNASSSHVLSPTLPSGSSAQSMSQDYRSSIDKRAEEERGAQSTTEAHPAIALIESMARRSDSEASMLLALLRTGRPLEEVAKVALQESPDFAQAWHQQAREPESDPGPVQSDPSPRPSPQDDQMDGLVHEHEQARSVETIAPWLQPLFGRHFWSQQPLVPTSIREPWQNDHISVDSKVRDSCFSFLTKDYPEALRERLQKSVYIPFWAIQPMVDLSIRDDPFNQVYIMLMSEVEHGADQVQLCGLHPHMGAFHDEQTYARAPKLSQVCVSIVRGIKSGDSTPTKSMYALMLLQWSLWRWLLFPSQETYDDLPETIRPTPWQLFMPLPVVHNFIVVPKLRDHLAVYQGDSMQWLTQACITVSCDLPLGYPDALVVDPRTGEQDLKTSCKEFASKPANWSFGPSVRGWLRNIDQFVTVRWEDAAA